jgi:cytochrome c biogenesis protein CcmG, thiol:disulfide interchange protein DsbE
MEATPGARSGHRASSTGRRRYGWRTIAGLSVASLVSGALMVILFLRLLTAGQAVSADPVSPIIGHHATNFTVSTWNGKIGTLLRLSDFAGKPVVVNFFGSWCAECVEEQPVLNAAWQKYHSSGVTFIGIAFRDQQPAATIYLDQQQVTYPCGPDPSGRAVVDYAVTGAPETAFISRSGIVVSKFIGPIDDGSLDQSIQALLHHV